MREERLVVQVSEKGLVELNLPEYSQQQVEIIVLPINDVESKTVMLDKLQVNSGFIQNELASLEEDVWNDL